MQAPRVLRLLEFKAALDDEVIEAAIHEAIAPSPGIVAGLLWTLGGRCVSGGERSYILATLWEDDEAMLAAVRDGDVAVYRPAFAPYLARAVVAVLDVDADWRWCETRPLSMFRLFRAADLTLEIDRAGLEPASITAPAPGDPGGGPCLVLSAESVDDRVLLAGWPGAGRAVADRLPPVEAGAMIASIDAMSRAGLGVEYEVTYDRAADLGG